MVKNLPAMPETWVQSLGWEDSLEKGMATHSKFRLKLKKIGKTTRPFRYDLNQIPYDYIVEVRNRFKGLDLIECLITMDGGS